MNFREYLNLKEAKDTSNSPNNSDASKGSKSNAKVNAEWRKFAVNFKLFVQYIGPDRLEKLLLTLRKNNSTEINSIISFDVPSGRTGSTAPIIEQRSNNFFIRDSINKQNQNSSITEGLGQASGFIIGSIGATIKDSIKATLGRFVKDFIGEYAKNFTLNPENDKEKAENAKNVKLNNTLEKTDIQNLKYHIWTKPLIEQLKSGTLKNTDPRITWVKTISKIPYDSVRPIGKSCLNTVVPWENPNNPPFDTAIQYICKNYGVKMLVNILFSIKFNKK